MVDLQLTVPSLCGIAALPSIPIHDGNKYFPVCVIPRVISWPARARSSLLFLPLVRGHVENFALRRRERERERGRERWGGGKRGLLPFRLNQLTPLAFLPPSLCLPLSAASGRLARSV